ncbi:PAS domain-containing sensor histidine kinase [Altererythrobacter sp. Z27]|uniref:PAS domain-containing sensor histidine kinase n=1 Tax=Altererythrobacter sp. Z27 TaxID=3461147 RepID=UPI004044AB3E
MPGMIAESEGNLHALIDTVPDAMVVIDEEGSILSFSTGAERMFGYAEAEVVGQNVSLLMAQPDRDQHTGYIEQYLVTGRAQIIGTSRVTTARHRDGHSFPINLAVGELKRGSQRGFVGFMRDLTESRQTERELHTLQAELAHVSRISSMGSLATSLAHELNQPLTAVVNYSNSARDLLDDPTPANLDLAREAMEECAREAIRAGQIVHRLRDFIASGETERQIASLRRIIQEGAALALINGDGRGVDFETEFGARFDKVLADSVQLQQVVVNLLRNALEAMSDATRKQLRIIVRDAPSGFVEVVIADSGPGLSRSVAERLFSPFNSTKAQGMGLGLSICHTIIAAHGGKIWAEPSDLGGAAFHFTLPLAEADDGE